MGVYLKGSEWYIDYYADGRRKREKIGPSKKLALDVLRKRKIQIAENRFLDIKRQDRVKFKDFAQTYMELHSKPNKRSWKTADVNSLKHLGSFFGERCLHEISPMMIEQYKIERSQKVSPRSVNIELACLRAMFNKAIAWGKHEENPVRKVKFFRENNKRLRYLEREEIEKLLAHCPPKLRAIVILALNTGMRKSEITFLKWKDIDFANGNICLLEQKNGQKDYLPLNEPAKKALIGIPKHPESPYVFCDKAGEPYNFRKSFETALMKSGIVGFRLHDLRHTFASHLAMSGVDLNTIRELLRHKSLAMTQRYAHLSKDHKARAVGVLASQMDTIWTPKRVEPKEQEFDEVARQFELESYNHAPIAQPG